MEVKYIRQILQSDPWRDRAISVSLSEFGKFVKDFGVDLSVSEAPYGGLPIKEQKEYCVMLLKQINKTPNDLRVEKDMLKKMVIKLYTEEEAKWALTFQDFERILREGYNEQ